MKHFKQFFVFALLALFSVGAWGEEASFAPSDFSGQGTSGTGSAISATVDGVTFACDKGYGTTQFRCYSGGKITISSSNTITAIAFTFSGSYNGGMETSYTGLSTTSWEKTLTSQARITACTVTYSAGSSSDPVAVTGVSLDEDAIALEVGEKQTLKATVSPNDATNKNVTWESDDTDVATVVDGLVTAIGAGNATITAKTDDGDFTATCDVIVTAASPKITITQNEVTDFTNTYAEYSWTAAGVSGKMYAYKNSGMQFNSGKTGYYVYNTDPIPGRITKITMIQASGTARNWTPYVSTTAMTSASGTALDAKSVTTSGASWDVTGSNRYFYLTVAGGSTVIGSIVIEYTEEAPPAVEAPSISGDENFVTSTTVTLSHADADHIYYTTNGDAPTTSSTEYSDPFELTNTATVKAIAVKGSDVSAVAEKTFTKVTPMTTAAALRGFATSSAQNAYIQLDGWKVTHVSGNNAYIIDPSNEGVILNNASHGYVAGDVLGDEVVEATIKLNYGRVQLSNFTSANITATAGSVASVEITDYSTIISAHQSRLVTLKDATYSSGDGTFSDGANVIYYFDQFSASPTLVDGATYDVTGVIIYYKTNTADKVEIAPRTAVDVEAKSAVVIPTAANLAALKAAERGTYILTLTNAVVSYVNGKNVFVEDASAGALIYLDTHSFVAGNCLNGDYQVTTTTYQGKFEITAIEPQTGAATTTAAIPLTTVTIAQLNADFASYESRRIKIEGVNVTDALTTSDRNGVISDGVNTVALYAGVASTIAVEQNANIDIIGYPGFHNTDEQLTVWAQADITVNVKEDPELAYDPVSESIELGDSWSAPTLANPHNLPLSFSSDKEALATVTDAGVIALVADATGTATITASFAGNATYNAGSATYTITVSVPDTRKKATLENIAATSGSFDRTDITYAAYQGDGTTPPAANGTDLRLYKPATGKETGGYIVISAVKGCTIDEVVVTNGDSKATTIGCSTTATLATSGEAYAKNASVSFESLNSSVVYIDNIGSERMDIIKIEVYYTGEPLAIDHYFLGGTYETTFEQNGTFDYTGLEVYASYDAGETITEPVEGFTVEADLSTAGSAEAIVKLNDVELIRYDITVTAGKEDPALAYTPESVTITAGDAWSAPTLSNTFNVAPITYSSDKESVATVDENGVITLAGGYGTAVITAHFDATAAYTESEATYTITVNKPAATPTSTVYHKVTATADITDGEYLIVYEGDATHDAAVFDGSLDNVDQAMKALPVEIVSDEIAGNTDLDAAVFTIDVTAGSLQSASGLYIGRETYDNGMEKSTTEAYVNTFAITDGAAVIKGAGNCTLRYNYASDQLRFRYYKSGQQAIQLYKKVTPVLTDVRTGLTPGNYYTICYPKAMKNIQGATLWSFIGKDTEFAYLVEETATTIEAGKPYILYATASTVQAELEGADAAAGSNGAIHGTLVPMNQDALNAAATTAGHDLYLVIGNQLRQATGDALTVGNSLPANRAYVILDEITGGKPAPAPGRNVRSMPMHKNAATGMDELNASEAPRKMIIDGKMYIFRGEKMYNANGQLVK